MKVDFWDNKEGMEKARRDIAVFIDEHGIDDIELLHQVMHDLSRGDWTLEDVAAVYLCRAQRGLS